LRATPAPVGGHGGSLAVFWRATKLHNSYTEDASFFKKRAEQIRAFNGLRLSASSGNPPCGLAEPD
jgi:hypothetical protein